MSNNANKIGNREEVFGLPGITFDITEGENEVISEKDACEQLFGLGSYEELFGNTSGKVEKTLAPGSKNPPHPDNIMGLWRKFPN